MSILVIIFMSAALLILLGGIYAIPILRTHDKESSGPVTHPGPEVYDPRLREQVERAYARQADRVESAS